MASAARTDEAPVIADEALLNNVFAPDRRLGVRRYFTIPGRDPFDEIEHQCVCRVTHQLLLHVLMKCGLSSSQLP